MNKELLQKHIKNYQEEKEANPGQFQEDWSEREEHIAKYQGYDEATIREMDEEDIYEYISPLWAIIKRKQRITLQWVTIPKNITAVPHV